MCNPHKSPSREGYPLPGGLKNQRRRRFTINFSIMQSTKFNIFMAVIVVGITVAFIEPGKCQNLLFITVSNS